MTTYKDAGVDVQVTDAIVNDISSLSKSTKRKGSVDSIGGFGGIFDLKQCGHIVLNQRYHQIHLSSQHYLFV